MEEDAKTRFLFKQVEHSDLHKSIEALKPQMVTNPSGTVSCNTSDNHLSTAIMILQNIYPGTGVRMQSVHEVGTNTVPTKLTEPLTLDISIIGDIF